MIIQETRNTRARQLVGLILLGISLSIVGKCRISRCFSVDTALCSAGVARVSSLHAKWVRASPEGALSTECQELNALHSQSVDGAQVKIPDRLTNPPERTESEPYILDVLEADRKVFADELLHSENMPLRDTVATMDNDGARDLLAALLQSQQSAVSEYELFNLALVVARKYKVDITQYLNHLDMSALSAQEKQALSLILDMSANDHPYIWNSMISSDILTPRDLYHRTLGRPFSIQRLYSSKTQGLTTFFEFLRMGTQEYTRKLLVFKVRLYPVWKECG